MYALLSSISAINYCDGCRFVCSVRIDTENIYSYTIHISSFLLIIQPSPSVIVANCDRIWIEHIYILLRYLSD